MNRNLVMDMVEKSRTQYNQSRIPLTGGYDDDETPEHSLPKCLQFERIFTNCMEFASRRELYEQSLKGVYVGDDAFPDSQQHYQWLHAHRQPPDTYQEVVENRRSIHRMELVKEMFNRMK